MVFRDGLERWNVELTDQPAQRLALKPTARDRAFLVAGVEDDEPALLHEGIDLGQRLVGERLGVLADRPVQKREERKLVLVDVDAHGLGGLQRGARGEHFA